MGVEKKKFFVSSLIGLLLMYQIRAQDIHFSQFYASPLNLNPSLSGVIDGNYRVAAIYRNQWSSISKDAPFVTAGGSFDMNIPFEKLKDIVGAGINLVNDKSGDGSLGMLHIALSLAYHKRLDKNGRHFIGWGIQPGYVQRSIFPNDLLFPSQYDGNTLNKDRPNGEDFGNTVIRYFDLNSGLLYSGKLSQRIGLMQGFSVYHLTRPKETFINDNSARLQNRFTVHGGLRIKVSERIYFTPNYIYQYQNKAQEINLGSAVELHFNSGRQNAVVFSMGGWYRLNDAAIASMTIEYKRMRLGASYDFNISELKPATNLRGGFELTLIFTGVFIKQNVGPLLVPCPRL
jgi:type IX secretion system PorP/SprF family membrane protein